MSATVAEVSTGHGPISRNLKLAALFWVFSYVLLTIRGAMILDDWGRLLDDNRVLTVTIGAVAYWLVLRQLDAGHKISLRGASIWIAAASLAVMIARVTIDELTFDVPQPITLHLLWSLTWSAYFGLWVMGSLAFGYRPSVEVARPAMMAKQAAPAATTKDLDTFELMAAALIAEAAQLSTADRAQLAARVLALGGYESAEASAHDNERARLALRLAARLSSVN